MSVCLDQLAKERVIKQVLGSYPKEEIKKLFQVS
jgi:hypothetical protein